MSKKQKQKSIAGGITAFLLLLIFVLMNIAAIPRRNLVTERYDEINWMRFTPRPVRIEKPDAPKSSRESQKKNIVAEQPVISRVDLSDLEKQLDLSDLNLETKSIAPSGKTAKTANTAPATSPISPTSKIDLSEFSDFNLALDEQSPLKQLPGQRQGGGGNGTIALQAGESSSISDNAALGDFGGNTGAKLSGPQAIGASSSTGEIDLKELAQMEDDLGNFSPIYKPLIEWMKRHPAVLPPVVNRFMGRKPGDLTSRVQFNIQQRAFEMFLLCVEETYEVRIVLVENQHVTYLIDQGFQKQSNFLRTGRVNRLDSGEILKFGTNLEPAGSGKTQEFYQIFMSWWESVKHEVE